MGEKYCVGPQQRARAHSATPSSALLHHCSEHGLARWTDDSPCLAPAMGRHQCRALQRQHRHHVAAKSRQDTRCSARLPSLPVCVSVRDSS